MYVHDGVAPTVIMVNPRTAMRAIPAGALSKTFVAIFVLASSAVLVLASWELNWLAFRLSPMALGIVPTTQKSR